MNRMRTASAALIIIVILIVGFVLSVPHTTKDTSSVSWQKSVATSTPIVAFHDGYRKGNHTITGTLVLPNPCTALSATANVSESASSTGMIVVSLVTHPDTGICLQIPGSGTFSVSLAAPQGTPISVLVNGTIASTTVQ